MPTNIGGINISIGADISKMVTGFETVIGSVKKFEGSLKRISIDGAIKGDPFSAQTKFVQKGKHRIDDFYKEWATRATTNSSLQSKHTKKYIDEITKVEKKIKELANIQDKLSESVLGRNRGNSGRQLRGSYTIKKQKGASGIKEHFGSTSESDRLAIDLKELKGVLPKENLKIVYELLAKLRKNTKMTSAEVSKDFIRLSAALNSATNKSAKSLEELGKEFIRLEKLTPETIYKNRIDAAKSMSLAIERQKEDLKELNVVTATARTEMKAGINVDQNRLAILSALENKQKLGIALTKEEIAEQKRLKEEQSVNSYRQRLEAATSTEIAIKKQKDAVKELNIVEATARTEIKAGINVSQNQLAILSALENKKRLGIKLSKEEIIEEKRLKQSQEESGYKSKLEAAKNIAIATKERTITVRELNVQEEKARTNIKAGINVEENKLAILKSLQEKQKLGIGLSQKEQKEMKRINDEITRRNKLQVATDYKKRLDAAKSTEIAIKKQKDTVKELNIAEATARTNIVAGIKVDESRLAILSALENKQKLGIKLTKEEIAEQIRLKQVQKDDSYKNRLDSANSMSVALDRQDKSLKDLNVTTAKARTELKAGINISQNRLAILSALDNKQKLGIKLTKEEIAEQKKLKKVTGDDSYKQRLDAAKNAELAIKRQKDAVKDLNIAEAKARTEISKGINVDKNKLAILNVLENKKRLGTKLTKKEIIEVKNLRQASLKLQNTPDKGFLSAAWFKQRASWFIQLRAFWSVWRKAQEAFTDVKTLEQSFANLQAITRSTNEELEIMKINALEAATSVAVPITELAAGMTKLGQAGLRPEIVGAAIKPISQLALSTVTDLETASDLVTTLYVAWDKKQEDLVQITNILANTVNKSKVEIKGLATSLQYLTGVAPRLGISLEDISSILGTMANRGIKMSKIGTGVRSLFGELLKPSKKFKDELYSIGLTLADVDVTTRGIIPVLETLKKANFDVSNAFKGLDRRAASAISALISGSGSLREFSKDLNESGTVAAMAAVQMRTLNSQLTVLNNQFIIFINNIYSRFKPGIIALTKGIGSLLKGVNELSPTIKSLLGDLIIAFTSGFVLVGIVKLLASIKMLTKALGILGKAIKFTAGSWVTLLIGAIIYGIIYLGKVTSKIEVLSKKLDEVSAKATTSSYKFNEFSKALKEFNEATDEIDKEKILATNDDLNRIVKETELIGHRTRKLKEYNDELEKKAKEDEKNRKEALSKTTQAVIEATGAEFGDFGKLEEGSVKFKSDESLRTKLGKTYNTKQSFAINAAKGIKVGIDQLKKSKEELIPEVIKIFNAYEKEAQDFIKKNIADGNTIKNDNIFLHLAEVFPEYMSMMEMAAVGFEEIHDRFIKSVTLDSKEIAEIQDLSEKAKRVAATLSEGNVVGSSDPLVNLIKKQKLGKDLENYFKENTEYKDAFYDSLEKNTNEAVTKLQKLNDAIKTNETYATIAREELTKLAKSISEETGTKFKDPSEDSIATYAQFLKNQAFDKAFASTKKDVAKSEKKILELAKSTLQVKLSSTRDQIESLKLYGLSETELEKIEGLHEKVRLKRVKIAEIDKESAYNAAKGKSNEAEIKRVADFKLAAAKKYAKEEKDIAIAASKEDRLKTVKKEHKLTLETLKFKIKMAKQDGITSDELADIYGWNEKSYNIKHNDLLETRKLAVERASGLVDEKELVVTANARYKLSKLKLDAEKAANDELAKSINLSNQRSKLDDKLDENLSSKERKLTLMKREKADLTDIIKLQLGMKRDEEDAIKAKIELGGSTKDITAFEKERRDIEQEILDLLHKQSRAKSLLINLSETLTEKMTGFQQMWRNVVDTIGLDAASGLENMAFDLTGGFQEAKQEAINLKGEVAELNQEKNEITQDGKKTIFTEDEVDRLKEINQEIDTMNREISDLENPMKNIGEAFKDLAKEIVDAIRRIIIEELALKAVQGVTNMLLSSFGGSSGTLDPGSTVGSNYTQAVQIKRGNGGILPSLPSFSNGGVTKGMSLAVVGDNSSGRELVIPEENISSDQVSGYTRNSKEEQQPIYIANVLTENDINMAMSKQGAGKVIINHVLGDLSQKGPVYKRLGGS